MNRAVLDAYGWSDISTDCDFILDYEEEDENQQAEGSKRHRVVDTQGLLLGVVVTKANTNDRVGAVIILMDDNCDKKDLDLIWVDSGYTGERFERAVYEVCGATYVARCRNNFSSINLLQPRRLYLIYF